MKSMKIIFIGSRNRLPDASSEVGTPVTWQLSVFLLRNIEIFSVLSVRIGTCLLEPLMLIGAVVDNQIHDDVHITLFGLCKQAVHRFQITKKRIDIIVIGDVVSLIHKWGLVYRRNPDNIDSKILQVIELSDDAFKITDSVSIAIRKAFRPDLVCNLSHPPFFLHLSIPPTF